MELSGTVYELSVLLCLYIRSRLVSLDLRYICTVGAMGSRYLGWCHVACSFGISSFNFKHQTIRLCNLPHTEHSCCWKWAAVRDSCNGQREELSSYD